jgi:chitinase
MVIIMKNSFFFPLIGMLIAGLLTISQAQAAQFTIGSSNNPYGGYQCIDVRGGNTANLTPVQAWDCHGWSNQQWTMQGFTIYGIGSTGGSAQKCLDVNNGGTANGTPVQLYQCNGGGAQQWYFYNSHFYNPRSNRCLDATDLANGRQLKIWDCANVPQQTFQIK